MKRFTNLILILAAFCFAQIANAQAEWLTGTRTQGYARLDNGTGKLVYLQLTDTSGTNNPVVLYDNDSASVNTKVLPGYTARQYYTTNIVRSYTDSRGVTTLRTNAVLFNGPLTVAATTNTARVVWSVTVPANGSVVIEPPEGIGYSFGLAMTNNGALNYSASIVQQD